ncbi:MAG: hypothetical protein B7Z35_15260 [Hydrogenophilales bacterium 12-61-10]|nr:MAG: hypothetical protein B7Z35_15260 [Hydrogenophilales bacterium 12-61-10]
MRVDSNDQAAGLRRRSAHAQIACIYCFFDTAEWTASLTRNLHDAGQTPLLIDRRGRLFGAAQTRSLFDWKQQLGRGELHTLPLQHGQGWYAPGVRADDPALREMARAYDSLVFDEDPSGADLILMPDAHQTFLIEIRASKPSMLRAFTLLKALSHHAGGHGKLVLLGDLDACAQVLSAANRFLPGDFGRALSCAAHVDAVFSALAVRMPGEETSREARFRTENDESMALKHG